MITFASSPALCEAVVVLLLLVLEKSQRCFSTSHINVQLEYNPFEQSDQCPVVFVRDRVEAIYFLCSLMRFCASNLT